MKELDRVLLVDYKVNIKNSVKAEAQSFSYPGHEAKTALNITTIAYEAKTSFLKSLSIGDIITFKISQDIEISVPNYKNKEDDELEFYVEGLGGGGIKEISEIDKSIDDESFQEVKITLEEGYAENL